MEVFKDIKIDQSNGQLILSLIDSNGQTINGEITLGQLIELNDEIEGILDPQRDLKERLKNLKRFKREAFKHYKEEKNSKQKEQRLNFYIETKRLVEELEEGLSNGS